MLLRVLFPSDRECAARVAARPAFGTHRKRAASTAELAVSLTRAPSRLCAGQFGAGGA